MLSDRKFFDLFVQLGQCVAGHSLSSLGSQQPVEILDHVLATEVCSLPVRDQHATALHDLHKQTQTNNYKKCIYVALFLNSYKMLSQKDTTHTAKSKT